MKAHFLGPIARIQGRLKKLMKLFLHRLDHLLKIGLAKLRTVMNRRGNAIVLPYMSFAVTGQLRLLGRVIEETRIPEFVKGAGRRKHLYNVVRAFLVYDLPHAKVQASFQGQCFEFESDDRGFFNKLIPLPKDFDSNASNEVEFQVLDSRNEHIPVNNDRSVGQVYYPRGEYFVVSDIDDTILKSHATSLIRLVFRTLFLPFEKRKSFLDTVAFYQSLHSGKPGEKENQFFYVSSSSWNLYSLLKAFIESTGFPLGPMLLQNLGAEGEPANTTDHEHKLHRIREIATQLDPLPFVLIGDAGQRDPYLYLQALKDFPGRVKGIYIRKLSWLHLPRDYEELISQSKKLGCEMRFFDSPKELMID